jgi:Ca2+-binding RTX toxin-like protein
VRSPAILGGNLGDDALFAIGSGASILIGGAGHDLLTGGIGENILIGGSLNLDPAIMNLALDTWSGRGSFESRTARLKPVFADKVIDDAQSDFLVGAGGRDWFFSAPGDVAADRNPNELLS